ncbi:molybdate ABC transporter substrate-binding protein [Streptomyces armeniacus]|uniref:Molybdate ABC transporter substrate-binding protein n=1 Tax=Streptomyces armeniacus TaxID=83291 RepID=A0A345XPL6_9ACTN|nr:molybdate ABC transporter substrate-binding protein [Streptomyces armeniacus]AXK33582.1 molybdate ABC transporter substrate-binding protein [Streptomyces armeniacus]
MPRTRARRAAGALAALLVLPLAACGGTGDSDGGGSGGRLTVMAASSLTDAFRTLGAAYEKEHPGTELKFSFAGSQQLAAQVEQGAPADVLVTADERTMDAVEADTGTPEVIARNRLVIVTGEGNPEHVTSLKDLAGGKLKVVLAAPAVPVGNYSAKALSAAHLTVRPVSEEPNVRAVLSKVALGEADAGLVYATDAASAPGKVDAVAVPDAQNQIASYLAATLDESGAPEAARSFVAWLKSAEARKILRNAGFQQP